MRLVVGLHLNVRDENGISHPPSYLSFLITSRDGRAKLAADLPELIVPRKKGSPEAANARKGWQLVSAFTSPHVCSDGEYLLTPDAGFLVAVGNLSFDEPSRSLR